MTAIFAQDLKPHTVMEWLFSTLVFPIYEISQATGLLQLLKEQPASPQALAGQLDLSERGVVCVLNCLVAAQILAPAAEGYKVQAESLPAEFSRVRDALSVLLDLINSGSLNRIKEDGILPDATPEILTTLGITEIVGSQQVLNAAGQRYFTPGLDTYLGSYLFYAHRLLQELIPQLPLVVKTGLPALRAEKNPAFFGPLVEVLFPVNFEAASQIADHVAALPDVRTVLDVGAGSGVWSIALTKKAPRVQADALDLPPVLDTTQAFTRRYGVHHQFRFLPGDLLQEAAWGDVLYDVIYICYICTGFTEKESQQIFTTAARHLRPGGTLISYDYLPAADRTGPLLDVFFAVLMLGVTDFGTSYPASLYEDWCKNAGLQDLEWITVPASSVPLLSARQRSQATASSLPTQEKKAVPAAVPFVPPTPIIEATFAFAQSSMLLAAVELQVFTAISRGAHTLDEIAQATESDASALERLLGGLHALGFVRQAGPRYELTPVSARYLVVGQPSYIGDVPRQIRQEWDAWIHLTDVIRTGKSVRAIDKEPLGGTFFAPLSEHLFPLLYPLMQQICTKLEVGIHTRGSQVLDLGAGTAPGAIAVLEKDPEAHAVVVDFANVLAHAKAHAIEHQVHDRIDYVPLDLEDLTVESQQFNLVLASHVFRIIGARLTQRLIQQSFATLQPGGRLVIIETYEEPERNWKLFPHTVSVNMLVNTSEGITFTAQQMRAWLISTGFSVEDWPNVGPDLILVATRP